MAKVIFEFDYYEDSCDLEMFRRASEMSESLNVIYNMVRSQLKHGDEKLSSNVEDLLEIILEESGEFN